MNTNTTTPILSWTARQKIPVERGTTWYVAAGLFVLICGAYSILAEEWTLTIVVITGAALYFLLHRSTSATHTIEIRSDGFSVDSTWTPWEHCEGFRMYKHGDWVELKIERKQGLNREWTTLVEGIDHELVGMEIARFLPYQADRRERLLDIFIRVCKL